MGRARRVRTMVGDVACELVAAPTATAAAALDALLSAWPARRRVLEPARYRVAVGGDGCVLRCLQAGLDDGLPCYGVAAGHVGFLANEVAAAELPERLAAADVVALRPLHVTVTRPDGTSRSARALNDVSIWRASSQAADISVTIDGVTRLEHLSGDGIVAATPLGSTAYSRSAGGPVLPLDATLVALTALAPYRPRFTGVVLPDTVEVVIEAHGGHRRPVAVCADQLELGRAATVRIHRDRGRHALLACDPHDHLAERVLAAAFAG